METIEEKNLLNYLTNLQFEYREKLNIDEDIYFGTEIEFLTDKKKPVDKIYKKMNNIHSKNKKTYRLSRGSRTVISKFDKSIYEIKTPVLNNTENNFKDLKYIIDELSNIDVVPGNQKGIHVHVDLSTLDENNHYLETLLKLFCVYEHIIFRFSFGEENRSNINYTSYSREISNKLYNFLKTNDFNKNFVESLQDLRQLLSCKSYAINFHQKDQCCKNETIEVRTFNGTFNPVIIQNDINLVTSIISKACSNNFDIDLLDYRFEEYDNGFYVKDSYSQLNLSDAVEFSDLIFDKNIDKDYFLRQYAIKDKPKTKKLVI